MPKRTLAGQIAGHSADATQNEFVDSPAYTIPSWAAQLEWLPVRSFLITSLLD